MMKSFSVTIITLFLLISCTSDLKEKNRRLNPAICCTQSLMKSIDSATGDSTKLQTRGWEGDVGPYDNFPSLIYPCDMIYVYTKTGATGGNLWNETPLAIPVIKSGGNQYIDICFQAEAGQDGYASSNSPIIITSGDQSITGTEFFFSSQPSLQVSMDKSDTIKTPRNKEVYEPFGDNLFTSSKIYEFQYDPRGNVIFEIHQSRWEDVTTFQVEMTRLTSVIIPRIIISDNYPEYKDGEPVQNGTTVFDPNKFTSKLGNPKDWSVRMFLSGKEGYTGFPIEFEMNSILEYGNSRDPNVLIGKVVDGDGSKKGIVALSEKELILNGEMSHSIRDNFGHEYTYKGIGVHDNSFPFIYWSENMDQMSLCCSFYYHGDDKNLKAINKERPKTVCFPINNSKLSHNNIVMTTFVIDVDDVVAALTETPFPDPPILLLTKSSRKTENDIFGTIIDIPVITLHN